MKGHWKKQFNYEYLGSYSLDGKKEIVVTISKLAQEQVTGQQGRKEDCFVVYFKEFDKGMILNRTNARAIEKVAGSGLIEDWKGKQVTLYVEKGVKAFGDVVDALRIRDKKVVLKQMTDDVVEKMEFAIKNGARDQVEMALSKYIMTESQKERMAKLLFTPIRKK